MSEHDNTPQQPADAPIVEPTTAAAAAATTPLPPVAPAVAPARTARSYFTAPMVAAFAAGAIIFGVIGGGVGLAAGHLLDRDRSSSWHHDRDGDGPMMRDRDDHMRGRYGDDSTDGPMPGGQLPGGMNGGRMNGVPGQQPGQGSLPGGTAPGGTVPTPPAPTTSPSAR